MNKKILIIINNLGVGGAERLVVNTLTEMKRREMHVSLLTLLPEKMLKTLKEQLPGNLVWDTIVFPSLLSFSSWKALISYLKRTKPDIVITHLWFANTIGRIAARIAGIKNVFPFEQNVYDTVKTWKQFLIDWLLQPLSTKIVAVAPSVKDSLIRHYIQEKRIEVIFNSIPVELYASATPSPIYQELGLSSHEFLFLFIGRLIHQKGVDVLIEAFSKVSKGHVLIVGDGVDRDSLEALAQLRGVSSRIHFLGVRHDVPALLKAADCFVLPSRHEGLPLALIEAAASGLPLIVSDFSSARDVIFDESAGVIVPVGDPQALTEAMNRVSHDMLLRHELAEGTKRIADKFSITRHVDELVRLINY